MSTPLELLMFGFAAVVQPSVPNAADLAMIPDAMLGCWEDVAIHNGVVHREFIEISRSAIVASFLPAHDSSRLVVEIDSDSPPGVIYSVSISLPKQVKEGSDFAHTLWMTEPDGLRVSDFWEPDEAEPDPEFNRCRPSDRYQRDN